MLTFRLLSITAIIGTLASAAPGVVIERTTCTAYCSATDNQGRPLVEQGVVPDIDLLYCQWKNGTTQEGYYYANDETWIVSRVLLTVVSCMLIVF
jgi:hypothetical protein